MCTIRLCLYTLSRGVHDVKDWINQLNSQYSSVSPTVLMDYLASLTCVLDGLCPIAQNEEIHNLTFQVAQNENAQVKLVL